MGGVVWEIEMARNWFGNITKMFVETNPSFGVLFVLYELLATFRLEYEDDYEFEF